MQDLAAERGYYSRLFERKPDNEHISGGHEELYDLAFQEVPLGAVLDLGCGTGGHAIRLARRGFDVIAVDLTTPGVRSARARLQREGLSGRFLVADAEHLPFRDGVADITWTSLLIHHFPKLDQLPNELARVTERKLIAFEPNAQNPLSWLAFNVINPIWGLSTTTKNQRSLWPKRLIRRFKRAHFRASYLHFIHRPWKDSKGSVSLIRKLFSAATSWMPMRFKANKFLVVFEKTTP